MCIFSPTKIAYTYNLKETIEILFQYLGSKGKGPSSIFTSALFVTLFVPELLHLRSLCGGDFPLGCLR